MWLSSRFGLAMAALFSKIKIAGDKNDHGGFLEGVYEIELDTKTEYEGF
jgi:hypothetical protein